MGEVEAGFLELHIDYAMTGAGTGSCGPYIFKKYRFSEKEFMFNYNLSFVELENIDEILFSGKDIYQE